MRRLAILLCLLLAGLAAPPLAAQANDSGVRSILFVVDTSGSMAGTPIEQAKGALRDVSATIAPGTDVGLRSYAGSCGYGGNLVVPVGPHDPVVFGAATDSLYAYGGTPTPDALRAAVGDLPSTGERTIVLISDGQSSCGDPCPTAAELHQNSGIDFTVHTVGFNVGQTASSELTCIAEVTGGTYHDVTDGEGLGDVLDQVVGDPCADYAMFGLRGSGQTGSDNGGYGPEVGQVQKRLEELLRGKDLSSSFVAVQYDSLGMDSFAGDVFSPLFGWPLVNKPLGESANFYAESMWGGSEKLHAAIEGYEAGCAASGEDPGRMILVGYSQGAAAVNWLSRSLTSEQVSRSALLLIGDPTRHSGDDPRFELGTEKANRKGVAPETKPSMGLLTLPQTRLNTTFTPLTDELAARTVSLCDARDFVCDTKDAIIWNDAREMFKVHTSYSQEKLDLAAVLAFGIANS